MPLTDVSIRNAKAGEKTVKLFDERGLYLDSLVLTCKDTAPTMASLTLEAFQELKQVIDETEATLSGLFSYDKLNYLVLIPTLKVIHLKDRPNYHRLNPMLQPNLEPVPAQTGAGIS